MPALLDTVDPDGLLEYSVVYTDRSLNHMSTRFGDAMRDIHATLCEVYDAEHAVIVPGSGSFAMEAVVRQFARGRRCLILRDGWFSYRWSQIIDTAGLDAGTTVIVSQAVDDSATSAWIPPPIDDLRAAILEHRPEVVFAPHVETSAGLRLPDDYIAELATIAHEVGALMVLDCIASGTHWISLADSGVDVLISAPQKGWSASPCAGLVMLSPKGVEWLGETISDSFVLDVRKWSDIMRAYLAGGHAYHATMPTDALIVFRDTMNEMRDIGFAELKSRQHELGTRIRALLADRGFKSVAAQGFEAAGVVVCHTDDDELHSGRAFRDAGLQIAAGVPIAVGEPDSWKTFRIGLFGIDKLLDVDAAVSRFDTALDKVSGSTEAHRRQAG